MPIQNVSKQYNYQGKKEKKKENMKIRNSNKK